MQGQRVAVLFQGEQASGEHNVQWHPDVAASSIYFYRLQVQQNAGTFSMTKKMIFMQ